MPVNILLTFIIGSVLGWLLIKITRAPTHLHGLVLGCCAAGKFPYMLNVVFFTILLCIISSFETIIKILMIISFTSHIEISAKSF